MGKPYAFFDVDGTLISLKSMFSFQDFWYANTAGNDHEQASFEEEMSELRRIGASREEMNRRYYTHFAGRRVTSVALAAERWYQHVERATIDLYHAPVAARLRRHIAEGVEPVFVSGSFPLILGPIARRLGVRHLLATTMHEDGGTFTGDILDPQTIGRGKADAITAFLAANDGDAAQCHGYGDDISDLPMLECVGRPVAVQGDHRLEALAGRAGWEVLPTR